MDLLEKAPETTELANRGGVGLGHDRPPQHPETHEPGDRHAGHAGHATQLVLVLRRETHIEAHGQGVRGPGLPCFHG